jgi:hypothetical protein
VGRGDSGARGHRRAEAAHAVTELVMETSTQEAATTRDSTGALVKDAED